MATYEATVRVTHISTSTKGRSALSVGAACGSAKANLNYITRADAAEAGNVIAFSRGEFLHGTTADLKTAALEAIAKRAEKHNEAYGVRLADKLIVSLPNDATINEQREMCSNILEEFVGDSEAYGMAAIHTDKTGNKHAHFFFVDGLETIEAAKARRPDAKRVRRADQLRMNEGGNRQDLRASVAHCINVVSAENGRAVAEVRSYKARGIDQEPQKHEGPQVADKLERGDDIRSMTSGVFSRLKSNANTLRKRLKKETIVGASILTHSIPSRYRKGWLGNVWRDWVYNTNKERTAGQDESTQNAVYEATEAFVADWAEQTPENAHTAQIEPPHTCQQTPALSDVLTKEGKERPTHNADLRAFKLRLAMEEAQRTKISVRLKPRLGRDTER